MYLGFTWYYSTKNSGLQAPAGGVRLRGTQIFVIFWADDKIALPTVFTKSTLTPTSVYQSESLTPVRVPLLKGFHLKPQNMNLMQNWLRDSSRKSPEQLKIGHFLPFAWVQDTLNPTK